MKSNKIVVFILLELNLAQYMYMLSYNDKISLM